MSCLKTISNSDDNKTMKRNLPVWMSERENVRNHHEKKAADTGLIEESKEGDTHEQANRGGSSSVKTTSQKSQSGGNSSASSLAAIDFSNLLDGVVFVLSGFVNPQRGTLRSQAVEMGATYKPDWNSDCTLLICAFRNTPKFRQVEADGGTIISEKWITECYNQKRLIDIESYLMHAGKQWRKPSTSHDSGLDQELSTSTKTCKQVEEGASSKPVNCGSSKGGASDLNQNHFSPSEVQKWAIDDLKKTMTWLESQEEKPEPSELKDIAAEGILTCLQDAIDSLKQEQSIRQITEQWKFLPRVVQELAKLEGTGKSPASRQKDDLYRQAVMCKQIYVVQLGNLDDNSMLKNKKSKTRGSVKNQNKGKVLAIDDLAAYDSDETIEMTEEEIDQAYNIVVSTLGNNTK